MSRTVQVLLRWVPFSLIVLAQAFLLISQIAGGRPFGDVVLGVIGFVVYVLVSWLIIARREGHPTGWLLLLTGLAVLFADGFSYVPGVSSLVIDWVQSWAWTAVFALFSLLILTFPSGHLPFGHSPWERTGRYVAWALPVLLLAAAFTETLGGEEMFNPTPSPVGFLPSWLSFVGTVGVIAILFGGAISLVVKRRRTTGAERAQLTWVVFAFVLLGGTVVLTFASIYISIAVGAGDPGDEVWAPAFLIYLLFPISFGVAVLRYRLYDIDRIVSRTVSYALVIGLLAAVFFGAVVLLSSLFPTRSDLTVAGSTLAVAALFNPLRRRIQGSVDRRFNRSQYDSQQVVDGFAETLRDRVVDANDVAEGWVGVVSETMQPSTVGVWVRGSGPIP
jgi:hypothetical protein